MAVSLATLYLRTMAILGPSQIASTNRVPTGADPGRWLLSQQLQSSGGEPMWKGAWAYLPTIPSLGFRVVEEFPQFGGAVLDQLASGGLDAGTAFYLSRPLPIITTHGVTGLTTLIAEACREVWFEDLLDLTTAANAYTIDLSNSKAWLDSEDRVRKDAQGRPCLYDPALATGYPPQLAPWRYDGLNFQTGVPTLQLKRAYFSTGGTAQLGVIRPAFSLVNGAESTTGPAVDADLVYADSTEIVNVALLRAYRYLATAEHISGEERQRYAGLVAPQEALVRSSVRHYLPRDEMAGRAA